MGIHLLISGCILTVVLVFLPLEIKLVKLIRRDIRQYWWLEVKKAWDEVL